MTEYRCFVCGHAASWGEVEFRNGETCHIGQCPPKPEGWQNCDGCERAVGPDDQVPYVELYEIDWETREVVGMVDRPHPLFPGVPWYEPKRQPAHVPLPPMFVMREPGTTGLNGVPEGAAGVAEWEPLVFRAGDEGVDEDGNPEPPADEEYRKVVCRDCAARARWPLPDRRSQTGAAAPDEPDPEEGLARIPQDGEWRSIEDAARLAGYGLRNGKPLVRAWARDGLLEVTERATGAGGSARKLYRRPVA